MRYQILVVLIGFNAILKAQFQVKNHYSFAGKKDVVVNCAFQNVDGFICFGANEGVFKFDGKTATRLLKEQNVLKQNITALYADEKEKLWIGTKSGKIYSIFKNKLDSIVLPENEEKKRITSFYKLNHVLFIGTYGNGLYTFSDNKIKSYKTENGLSDDVIYKIIGDEKNRVWCATDAGISELSNANTTPNFKIISDKNGLPDNIVRDISLVDEKLLISMQDSGVCYYNLQKQEIEKLRFFTEWTHGTVLNAISRDNGKTMIVATERNGLLQIKNGIISLYTYQDLLHLDNINQMMSDKAGGLWLASKKGISQLEEKRLNLINTSRGMENEKILALAADNNNAIWYGTTNGIAKMISGDRGNLVFQNIQDINKFTISCATKAPDGSIWFGTYGNGIIVLSADNKSNFIYNSSQNMLANDNISHIFFSDKNTIYVSTLGGGLVKVHVEWEKQNVFKIENTYKQENGLGNEYVYSAVTDKNGKLFVATDGGGLQVFENGKFINLTQKFGFMSNTIFSLCTDKLNNVWAISNEDGLLKYDGEKLISLTQNEGLRELQPQQIIAKDEMLFVLNSKGIDKVNIKDNSVSYYDFTEGELDPNLNAILIHGNALYSGTNNGILTYRVNNEKHDSVKPLVYIKGFYLNYKPFPLDSIYEFKHNQNNIALSFDGIWLRNPDKLRFRYRLDGLENDWLYSEEGKTINYNNLNPGNYTFIVQAKNEEDIWSDPTGYAFIIKTPIWKRWWFWLIVLAAIGFSVYSFFKYRLRALKKENLILEQRVAERTAEVVKQKHIIEEKHKEITDSINYAERIQRSFMATKDLLDQNLKDYFVFFKPKDVVSGDFYWAAKLYPESEGGRSLFALATADSTGHGVPGAIMSLLNITSLEKAIEKNHSPADILNATRKTIIERLKKDGSAEGGKDGMDCSLCVFDFEKMKMYASAANNPVWIARNTEVIEIKADKMPVGKHDRQDVSFSLHEIDLQKGDVIFSLTDGFPDQFGGPYGKKFMSKNLRELLTKNAHLPLAEQKEILIRVFNEWIGENEQIDDVTVIGFKV